MAAVAVAAQLEMEIAQLPARRCRRVPREPGPRRRPRCPRWSPAPTICSGLISFLTAGPDEVRAWTIRRGTLAPQAAGTIHSDLERGFIRAEVISYRRPGRRRGHGRGEEARHLRMEGKTYVVKDGDV